MAAPSQRTYSGKSLGQHLEEHAHLCCQVLAIRVERDNLQPRFQVIRQQRDQRSGNDERDGMGLEAA